MLRLLKDRLMQPAAVAQFIKAVSNETNARNGTASARAAQLQSERATVTRKLEDSMTPLLTVCGQLRSGKTRLEALETRLGEIRREASSAPAPSSVRLHPEPSEYFVSRSPELADTSSDPAIRTRALEIIRGPITSVTV